MRSNPLLTLTACSMALACGIAVGTQGGIDAPNLRPSTPPADAALLIYRQGLSRVLAYVGARPDLFPSTRPAEVRLLLREDKVAVWRAWQAFLDYLVALEAIERGHRNFFSLKGAAREESFLLAQAAHAGKYRFALELIQRAENNPAFDTVLNDAAPELGLPEGTYRRVKFQYLNVAQAGEFAAWESAAAIIGGTRLPAVRQVIREDSARIWQFAKGSGERLTVENGLRILQHTAFKAWFPVQAGTSEWMGDTRVRRQGSPLVSPSQARKLIAILEPGDVLLTRSEWFLSNIGLPGFWPHAALYIGTAEQRRRYFDDPGTRAWIDAQGVSTGDFETLAAQRYPQAYAISLKPQEAGHVPRVIEAISEGVSLTTCEHTARCDSLVALRPRLEKRDKAAALLRAFHFVGRPYDFNFDFQTDAALVCTELVFKSYEPRSDCRGLSLPVEEVLGHLVTPANAIARQFDAQLGTPQQQFDLVTFLDGQERARKAVAADLDTFRQSWKRPKWHILFQDQVEERP